MTDPRHITVKGAAPYDVVVGTDLAAQVAPALEGATRVAVIHPAVMSDLASRVAARLPQQVHPLEVPDGERSKDLPVAAGLWEALGAAGFTRNDAVVAVGGGATTDLAGFVAATWLRGVRVVHVPTTLLAMVDAAVGGKTGINTGAGKNLVGSFHPPARVVCDLDTLATLPQADYVAGLAEALKVGFTHDPQILDLVEADPAAARSPAGPHTREIVERAIAVKAAVVGEDLTEQGGREVLNYGHTLAHAIEKVTDYGWRHGDAVSVGLCFAAELGARAGSLDEAVVARHREVLTSVGLPTSYDGPFDPLLATMAVDKKSRGSRLRFIVLDALASARVLEAPDSADLIAAYETVRA